MKKLLIFLFLSLGAFMSSCSNDDNKLGDKAEEAWISFIQKNLIGEWNPKKLVLKPVVGDALFTMSYPTIADCNESTLLFNRDFTGKFTDYKESCLTTNMNLQWKHRLGVLIFELENGKDLTAFLLKKSPEYLVLDFKAIDAMPILKQYYPDIVNVPADQLALLVLQVTFLKK